MLEKKLAGVKRLIEEGFVEEAGVVISRIEPLFGNESYKELLKLACQIAETSQDAAVLVVERHMGTTVWQPVKMELEDKRIAKILRAATEGADADLSVRAYSLLGRHLTAQKGIKAFGEGIGNLQYARSCGNIDAMFALAELSKAGHRHLNQDSRAAMELYAEIVEQHEDPSAMYELAALMIVHDPDFEDYDIEFLMEQAAESGIDEAECYLENQHLELDSEDLPDVPYNVTPSDPIRLRMARNAIMSAFATSQENAEVVIASLHGYYDWDDLIEDARHKDGPKGTFDEQSPKVLLSGFHQAQAGILVEAFGTSLETAQAIIKHLSLTSNGKLPDLSKMSGHVGRTN